jgi:hypothetical protein
MRFWRWMQRRLLPLRRAAGFWLTVGVMALYGALFVRSEVSGPGLADGFYSYLFARSLAYDGGIDFTNDYQLCGDHYQVGIDRGTGHPDNQAYMGPAVFWTPVVWVARHLVDVPAQAPAALRAGCAGGVAKSALFTAVPLGGLAIGLSYLAARRFARQSIALFAALLFAVASNLPTYAALLPSSSHVYEAFCAALLLWLAGRAHDRRRWQSWIWVGIAAGLCVLQRLSDVVLILLPLVWIANSSSTRRFKLTAVGIVAAGAAIGIVVTLWVYLFLYGWPLSLPQGRHYLHLGHAHPLLTLFAPHGGLFYVTPVAYLAFVGLFVALKSSETRALGVGAALCIVGCLWISSAVLDWHGKGTYGARRLVVLIPLFIVLTAVALQWAERWLNRRWSTVAAAAVLLLVGAPAIGAPLAIIRNELPVSGASPQATQYGNPIRALWAELDDHFDLAVLPAELVYSARFGLPMHTFRASSTDLFYRRSYRTLQWEPNTLPLSHPVLQESSSGFEIAPEGLVLTGREGYWVFAAQWPFATDASLVLDSAAESNLALEIGTFFSSCELGSQPVPRGTEVRVHWAIPNGCFDSGLVQVRFHRDASAKILLRRLTLEDSTVYPLPY